MFVTDLAVRYDHNAGLWVLTKNLVFRRPDGEIVTAPAGTKTDMDSVPRLPLVYMRLKDRARKSAVLHDSLYAHGSTMEPHFRNVTRKEADQIFLEAMESEGLPRRWRWSIYWGVRGGGLLAWRGHRA